MSSSESLASSMVEAQDRRGLRGSLLFQSNSVVSRDDDGLMIENDDDDDGRANLLSHDGHHEDTNDTSVEIHHHHGGIQQDTTTNTTTNVQDNNGSNTNNNNNNNNRHAAMSRLAQTLQRLRRTNRNRHSHRNFSEVNGYHIAYGSKMPFWKNGLVNSVTTMYFAFLQLSLILFKLESHFMFGAPVNVFGWVLVMIPSYIMCLIFGISIIYWAVKDLIKWRRHYNRQYRRFERYRSQLDPNNIHSITFRNADPLTYSSVRSVQREKRKAIDRFVGYSLFIGILVVLTSTVLISLKIDLPEQMTSVTFIALFSPLIAYAILQTLCAYVYLGIMMGASSFRAQLLLEVSGVLLCILAFLTLLAIRLDKFVSFIPFAFSIIPLFCLNTALLLYDIIFAVRSFSPAPNPNKNNLIKDDNFMTLSGLLITIYNGTERRRREENGEQLADEVESALSDSQRKQRLKNRIDSIIAAVSTIPTNICLGLISYYSEMQELKWFEYLGIFIPLLVPLFFICIWVTFRSKIIERFYKPPAAQETPSREEEMEEVDRPMSVRDILNNSEGMRSIRSGNTTTMSPLMILYLHSLIREQQEQQEQAASEGGTADNSRNVALMQLLQEMMESRSQPVSQGLTREYLATLPTHIYKPQEGVQINTTCPICLCDYEEGDVLRTLPCFHIFHKDCIDNWLLQKKICAICKHEVDTYNEQSFYGDDDSGDHNV